MIKIKQHNINIRHFFMMCFIVFAFSPCTVKNVFSDAFGITSVKPLNKIKTTTNSTNFCQYIQSDKNQTLTSKKSKIYKSDFVYFEVLKNAFVFKSSNKKTYYLKHFSSNSPPMYILFKRLKLDVA